ncbi:MAG TPA: alpha/beta hydrolase [Ktedonobacterales bacterium]|nr:alpha/beta hydrolase [Ktedonobacterales bacterium]
MDVDTFSLKKRCLPVGAARVAYYEEGTGELVVLLHGCPFSSYIWRKIIPRLSTQHRCLAPDLLGLGDTETPAHTDWSLPAQEAMVVGWLDALGITQAHVVGHDHGGAVAQLLAAHHPERIKRLVLSNAEAYDNWPSAEERPLVRLTQVPLVGTLFLWAYGSTLGTRVVLSIGQAVKHKAVLTDELIKGYVRANTSDAHRRAKTARFLAGQFDPANNRCTLEALEGLRRFDHPTLLLWGADDPHFGPAWAERLRLDIPGVTRLELLPNTGHLLMEERPETFATHLLTFLSATTSELKSPRAAGDRET